jgi:hypothetical protein
MKTITETIGGAQGLLNISYNLQDVFEEYLTDEYKTFLHMLRVLEEAQKPLVRGYAGPEGSRINTSRLSGASLQNAFSK